MLILFTAHLVFAVKFPLIMQMHIRPVAVVRAIGRKPIVCDMLWKQPPAGGYTSQRLHESLPTVRPLLSVLCIVEGYVG